MAEAWAKQVLQVPPEFKRFKSIHAIQRLQCANRKLVLPRDATRSRLEHVKGQPMLVDFWATWCPPCQAPMFHNEKMIREHPEWAGKLRIVGLSLDREAKTVVDHCNSKLWYNVEHYIVQDQQVAADWAI